VKHSQALQDVIELTDDEFMPNQPPSKSKKKIKEKAVQDLPETDESASSARAPQLFQLPNDPMTINARNKVQPRPFRMTSHSPNLVLLHLIVSQTTILTLIYLLTYPSQDLSLRTETSILLPLNFYLLLGNIPILRCYLLVLKKTAVISYMLPPATFFVGSSSLAPPVLTTPLPPQPQSADMVNSTSTVIEPLKDANANINTRTKNTRKPRKKQVEIGNVDFDAPQAKIREKEKTGIN